MWKRKGEGEEGPQEAPTITVVPSTVHRINQIVETLETIQLDLLEQKMGQRRSSKVRTCDGRRPPS